MLDGIQTNGYTEPGWSSHYYELPDDVRELQDLIEHREMNFAVGNIFKAAYRLGEKEGVDAAYDLNKIIWFANRELKRIEQENESVNTSNLHSRECRRGETVDRSSERQYQFTGKVAFEALDRYDRGCAELIENRDLGLTEFNFGIGQLKNEFINDIRSSTKVCGGQRHQSGGGPWDRQGRADSEEGER